MTFIKSNLPDLYDYMYDESDVDVKFGSKIFPARARSLSRFKSIFSLYRDFIVLNLKPDYFVKTYGVFSALLETITARYFIVFDLTLLQY